MKSERKRKLKDKKDINQLDINSTEIFSNNMIDTYYPNRPDNLEHLCLHSLVSQFDFKTKSCSDKESHQECVKLKNNLGFLHKRNEIQLIKTPVYKSTSHVNRESYFHQILMLFKPWRNEEELLNGFNSYEKAFENAIDNKTINIDSFEKFKAQKKKIQDAINLIKQFEEISILDENNNMMVNSTIDCQIQNSIIPDICTEYQTNLIDVNELERKKEKLNKGQLKVYNEVINRIKHQKCHTDGSCSCSKDYEPIRIFCSGVAGIH